ncbi:hypothetical protein Pelo_13361 [Pelomyxa schiedti]|nr:hypothetical protein Pelo_13361 [Pelomyxa schiedti]
MCLRFLAFQFQEGSAVVIEDTDAETWVQLWYFRDSLRGRQEQGGKSRRTPRRMCVQLHSSGTFLYSTYMHSATVGAGLAMNK